MVKNWSRSTPESGPNRGVAREVALEGVLGVRVVRVQELYLTSSVFNVILQKSTPPQICQSIHYYH